MKADATLSQPSFNAGLLQRFHPNKLSFNTKGMNRDIAAANLYLENPWSEDRKVNQRVLKRKFRNMEVISHKLPSFTHPSIRKNKSYTLKKWVELRITETHSKMNYSPLEPLSPTIVVEHLIGCRVSILVTLKNKSITRKLMSVFYHLAGSNNTRCLQDLLAVAVLI